MGFTCLKAVDSLRGDSLCFTTKVSGDSGIHLTDLWGMKGWVVFGAIQWFWTWEPWIGNPTPMLLLQVKTKYLLSEKEYCTLFQIINYIYWSFKYNWQISCNDLFRLSQGFWQGGLRLNFFGISFSCVGLVTSINSFTWLKLFSPISSLKLK